MRRPRRLLLATRNPGKLAEQRRALAPTGIELVGLDAFPGLAEPEETGESFAENARIKALYYHRATGLPSVGEDSGLEVDALGGAPGVRSARWLGRDTSYEAKNRRLVELLAGRRQSERGARFVSAVALADEDAIVFEAVGICEGRIADEPRGTGGFGYDPVFFYPPLGKTLAELAPEEKDGVSHRGRAMARLREFLDRLGDASL